MSDNYFYIYISHVKNDNNKRSCAIGIYYTTVGLISTLCQQCNERNDNK